MSELLTNLHACAHAGGFNPTVRTNMRIDQYGGVTPSPSVCSNGGPTLCD